MFKDKVLLITGGTGSFGNAVLSHFLHSDFAEIRVFSRDEKKQEDMRLAFRNDKLKFHIGDVRDYDSVHDALRHFTAIEWLDGREMYRCEGACGKTLVCAATRCSRCCPRALSTTAAHVRLRRVRRFAPRRCCRSTCRRSCS